jgi:NAD(P)-dependent dehydrogenase (short-subunit alcohol dehydrogenase family)
METNLDGKLVLITGAASGIGRATAEAFGREGGRLALADINADGLAEVESSLSDEGVEVHTVTADLGTKAGVEDGVRAALDPFDGAVDVVVNNVGTGSVRTFDDLSDEDWEQTFEINFFSCLRTIRQVLPVMRERGGTIVNNASDLGRQPEPNPVDYAVSKTALLGLTKALARSEAPKIRVNAVAPGPIWTPFWTKPGGFADTLSEVHEMPPKEAVEHEMSLRQMPLNRLGEPEEVANVIVFLASDLASFVTSSVYGVDGGTIRSLF